MNQITLNLGRFLDLIIHLVEKNQNTNVTLAFCQLHRNMTQTKSSDCYREIVFDITPQNKKDKKKSSKASPFRHNMEESGQNYSESDLQLILLNQKLKDQKIQSWKDSLENSLNNSFEKLEYDKDIPLIFEAENFKSFEIAKVQDSYFHSKVDPIFENFNIDRRSKIQESDLVNNNMPKKRQVSKRSSTKNMEESGILILKI